MLINSNSNSNKLASYKPRTIKENRHKCDINIDVSFNDFEIHDFERHSLKIGGYSALAPEDIVLFVLFYLF
jgi:hypothetical protein